MWIVLHYKKQYSTYYNNKYIPFQYLTFANWSMMTTWPIDSRLSCMSLNMSDQLSKKVHSICWDLAQKITKKKIKQKKKHIRYRYKITSQSIIMLIQISFVKYINVLSILQHYGSPLLIITKGYRISNRHDGSNDIC